jgi:hypothetical protein
MAGHASGSADSHLYVACSEEPHRSWEILARNVVAENKEMKANFSMVFLGGLIGTPAMSAALFMAAPLVGIKVDFVAMLAEMLGWRMGMLVHILNGVVIFPAVFAFLLYRFLPGSPVAKGMAFGSALWLISQVMVMPIMGAGLFSSHAGGIGAVAASLVGHVVYGGFLGLFPMLAHEAGFSEKPRSVSP